VKTAGLLCMGLLNHGGVNEMAPMYIFKYRGQRIQGSVMVDELLLEQDCLRLGVSWITPRTRYTFFASLLRIAKAISVPRRRSRQWKP
jgi:hypothetical protein